MIMPLVSLLLVVALLGLLLSAIRRLTHASLEGQLDPRDAVDALSPPETYHPVNRLFTAEDMAFVAEATKGSGKLRGRLRGARSRVMRLYLRQIQTDFNSLWRLALYIASRSADPNFAALVTRQFCAFYFLLALVRLRAVFGWRLPIPVHVSGLVSAMELLRMGVVRTVADLGPTTVRTALTRG
jgi:hypothetical protein